MTEEEVSRALQDINGSEILLVDKWSDGIAQVRTPFFCLLEDDCELSANYFSSNVSLFQKNKFYRKLAMVSSCLGVKTFDNRIYSYCLKQYTSETVNGMSTGGWTVGPCKDKKSTTLYNVQVGFVPGAIIRSSAVRDIVDKSFWNMPNLIDMSAQVCFYFWGTGRRVLVNPNTTYVSTEGYLEKPTNHDYRVPISAKKIFIGEKF